MLSSLLLAMPAAPAPPRVVFADVYAEHGAFVWRSLRRLGVREADIEDVCQEAFVVAHRKLGDFREGSMRAWLFAIALRVASDYRKRAHIRTEVALDLAMEPWAAAEQPRQIDRARAKAWLEAILASLEEDKRVVFIAYELEEMPMKDVAAAAGCPLQTAYSRLHAARAHVTSAIARLQKRERSEA